MKRFVVSGMGRAYTLLAITVLIHLLTRTGTAVADVLALGLAVIGVVIVFAPAGIQERHVSRS
jgi:Ca2+/Na+ antiporter